MITSLSGKNVFALKARLKELESKARKEFGSESIEKINAQESALDDMLQAVQSLSLFTPYKLVVIDEVAENKELMERIEELVDRTHENVELVLIGPNFDKRSKGFKSLKKLTNLEEFSEPNRHELPRWVVKQAKDIGANISTKDANYLVERIGLNQMQLNSELQKLSLYSPGITRDSIDKLTDQSVQSSVFSILDSAFSGKSDKAIKLYREQRAQKLDPHYMIAMLTWQLQAIAMGVYASPQTESVLIEAGQSPFTARKTLGLAKNVSKTEVKSMITNLSEVDRNIKTDTDADAALELYLISLSKS